MRVFSLNERERRLVAVWVFGALGVVAAVVTAFVAASVSGVFTTTEVGRAALVDELPLNGTRLSASEREAILRDPSRSVDYTAKQLLLLCDRPDQIVQAVLRSSLMANAPRELRAHAVRLVWYVVKYHFLMGSSRDLSDEFRLLGESLEMDADVALREDLFSLLRLVLLNHADTPSMDLLPAVQILYGIPLSSSQVVEWRGRLHDLQSRLGERGDRSSDGSGIQDTVGHVLESLDEGRGDSRLANDLCK